MDERCLDLAADLVSTRYIAAGRESLQATARTLRSLLAQRQCPEEGLSDAAIELLLRQLAMMDTNNFAAHVGGGEREGRVISSLVRHRHFDFAHGIGRSGDLISEQPKAAGSSLLYKLTNLLMLDLIRLSGAPATAAAVVVPMATGMTLALVLRCVAKSRMKELAAVASAAEEASESTTAPTAPFAAGAVHAAGTPAPQYVIWPRIDQKTALKCIDAAGLTPVPVPLRPVPPLHAAVSNETSTKAEEAARDPMRASAPDDVAAAAAVFWECHIDDLDAAVQSVGGPSQVVCVLSTTSCFAPRLPDNTVAIARYCKEHNIPYVVNNAYGVQSRRIMTRLDAAQRDGRVDFFIQSGDKNFLVPVGGSVVCSSRRERCDAAAALYAGRASMSPILDLFITALSLGRRGMRELWSARYRCRALLLRELRAFARERGETLLIDDADGEGQEGEAQPQQGKSRDAATEQVRAKGASEECTNTAPMSAALPAGPIKHPAKTQRAAPAPRNDISVALTMLHFGHPVTSSSAIESEDTRGAKAEQRAEDGGSTVKHDSREKEEWAGQRWAAQRAFGAQLFRSAVTGPRVILPAPATSTTIAGCTFHNYGMHQEGIPSCPMLVIACGIGMTAGEVAGLMQRLRELWPARRGECGK